MLKRLYLAVVLVLVAWLVPSMPAAQAATPANYDLLTECENEATAYETWFEKNFSGTGKAFPGEPDTGNKRVLIEAQGWWFPHERDTGGDEDRGGIETGNSLGHIHTTVCAPYWDDDMTGTVQDNRYMRVHAKVEIHLGGGVPEGLDNYPTPSLEVRLQEFAARGEEDAGNESVDLFNGFSPVPTCEKGEHCAWYFSFGGSQSSSQTCTSFDDGDPVSTESLACSAPRMDIYQSSRVFPGQSGTGFDANGLKQLRLFPKTKVFVNGNHDATMRAIVRTPFRMGIGQYLDIPEIHVEQSDRHAETSGWWVNDDLNGAGGYATIALNPGNNVDPPDYDIAPLNQYLTTGVYQMPPVKAFTEGCAGDCSVETRELAGVRTYAKPDFHNLGNPGYVEKDDREKNILFPIDPADCATNPSCETDGTLSHTFTGNQRNVDLTDEGISAGGLHKITIIVRQPTQDDVSPNGAVIPTKDESTLFGIYTLFFVTSDPV